MKSAENFIFKKMKETGVVVPVGERSLDFHGMVTLNDTGSFLWEKLQSETTRENLIAALAEEYDVDSATAEADVDAFLKELKEAGLLAE